MPAKRMTVKPNIIPFTNREAGAGFTRPMRQTPGASPPDLEHRPVGTNMPRITMTVKPNIIPFPRGKGDRRRRSPAQANASAEVHRPENTVRAVPPVPVRPLVVRPARTAEAQIFDQATF